MTYRFRIEETQERVVPGQADFSSRFRWRAARACRRYNEARDRIWGTAPPLYRYEVIRDGDRWVVAALQNRPVPGE